MLNVNHTSNHKRPDKRFRYVAGDFWFASLKSRYRRVSFLHRNIDSFLDNHQSRLQRALAQSELQPENTRIANHTAIPTNSTLGLAGFGISTENPTNRSSATQDHSLVVGTTNGEDHPLQVSTASSKMATPRNPADTGKSRTSRRSLRNLDHQNFQPDSSKQLVIDLKNIRKKLNFKTNWHDNSERAAKRRKRDKIHCKCHLTVWDNREGAQEASLRALTKDCWVTSMETENDGYFVEIELESPFILTTQDLKVTQKTKHGLTTTITDKYFMEIKILPCRPGCIWPPIPTLGKSDGDQYAPDVKADSGELHGTISARYTRLPLAPERDVALSVYFLFGGITYRTKYGLQVFSEWQSPAVSEPNNGIDLVSFRAEAQSLESNDHQESNNKRRTNGVALSNGQQEHNTAPKSKEKPISKSTASALRRVDERAAPQVSYSFAPSCSTDFNQRYPHVKVEGYRCLTCIGWKTAQLEKLLFHLSTCHSKYVFEVQRARRSLPETNSAHVEIKVDLAVPPTSKRELAKRGPLSKRVVLKVNQASTARTGHLQGADQSILRTDQAQDHPFEPPRSLPLYDHERLDERDFSWAAPKEPFNLKAYTNGDKSWVGLPPKKSDATKITLPIQSNTGRHVTPSAVPDFRKPNYKRYPPVSLNSSGAGYQPSYTSVTHRALSPSEDPLSETDDEIDNEWQIQQHMENLDHFAKEAGWSNQQRDFRKRWDRHRMEERYEHASYISNSLVRFARKNQKWLANADHELLKIFFEFLQLLQSQRRIDNAFVLDLTKMIYLTPSAKSSGQGINGLRNGFRMYEDSARDQVDGLPIPSHDGEDEDDFALQLSLQPNKLLDPTKHVTSPRSSNTDIRRPSKGHCGMCFKHVDRPTSNGTFCTSEHCNTPTIMYHKECIEGANGGDKGKTKALDFDKWNCKSCCPETNATNVINNIIPTIINNITSPTTTTGHIQSPFNERERRPYQGGLHHSPQQQDRPSHRHWPPMQMDGPFENTPYMKRVSPGTRNGELANGRPYSEPVDARQQMDKLKKLTQPRSLLSQVNFVRYHATVEDVVDDDEEDAEANDH